MTGARRKRVLVFGASGTAGQGAVRALIEAGHSVTCVLRAPGNLPSGADEIRADVTQPLQIPGAFDVVVSCLASRSGRAKDAWAIDHSAQLNVLAWAKAANVTLFILLSAICVQKPKLPFQNAKLAFEQALMSSGLAYSIVRPTAFFKSLSGQLDRVRAGRPFLVFGEGCLTACKPISDDDLGRFMAGCIDDPTRRNQILPIGGPGPAITPMDQAATLFAAAGQPMNVRCMPVGLFRVIRCVLQVVGCVIPKAAEKAELAQIGHYYATESMLVLDPDTGQYDEAATPSTGSDTLEQHYAKLIAENASEARGDHAVF
ncbi:MAG: NAD(P)H-binding protein [Paracoccaceae bacterium]